MTLERTSFINLAMSLPRHIAHSYLNFVHGQTGSYRQNCYEALLRAVQKELGNPEQEAAGCRIALETALSVDRRGSIWVRCKTLAAMGSETCSNAAVRLAYWLLMEGMEPPKAVDIRRLELACESLEDLTQRDALTAYFVTSLLRPNASELPPMLRQRLMLSHEIAASIVRVHRRTRPNVIDSFLEDEESI